MRYLGIDPKPPRIGVFDFTGCEGCELQLANKEETLAAFLDTVEIVVFREVSSARSDDALDVALVDGCITRQDEVQRLQSIRQRSRLLVALGSCACFGGITRMKDAVDTAAANRIVYGDTPKDTGPARPLHDVVPVDLELRGCPVSKHEVERVMQHLLLGFEYRPVEVPVCMDCRQQFTSCLWNRGEICLGPVTRAGCQAPCPRGGLGCWGCRGPADDANVPQLLSLAEERGIPRSSVEERLRFFGGFEEKA